MSLTNTEKQPDLSIIIVSFNTKALTRRCLECVERYSDGLDLEVIVVDNASKDGSADMVSDEFPNVKLIKLHENRGFAGGNIPGMSKAAGRHILLLNSDAFIDEGVLKKTVSFMDQHKEIGILGCKLIGTDGALQASARMLPSPLNKILHITGLAARFPKSRFFGRVDFSWWNHTEPRSVGWVVGAYFLIRRKTMEEIGVLDDRYFLYYEEIDYCLRARRSGWNVVFYPHASVIHLGGQSIDSKGQIVTPGSQLKKIRIISEFLYYRKFYGLIHVIVSASIELSWNCLVFIKNFFDKSMNGIIKRRESNQTIRLIISALWDERFGRGREVF